MAERYPWGKCLLEADFSRSSASVHAPLAGAGADRRLDLGCPLGAVGDDHQVVAEDDFVPVALLVPEPVLVVQPCVKNLGGG
jgi:hypothetical protein